jgi:hypothetical protein
MSSKSKAKINDAIKAIATNTSPTLVKKTKGVKKPIIEEED